MNNAHLSSEQKRLAVQRLTALWAFSESGLGGVVHALKIPFTGLMLGGFAVIIITLIAHFSDKGYKQILQSLIIVLLVKLAVSPHTPFPAYIAVFFQALLGFVLFSLLHVNFLSIFLLSTVAMIESVVQKFLILTLFFGQAIWKAADELVKYIGKQFSINVSNGDYWIVGIIH